MKVAVIHNLRHRSGDLRELFLLRAIRVFRPGSSRCSWCWFPEN